MTFGTMELIQTVTVGSGGAANIEFTNIPQTYDDLQVVFSVRSNRSTSAADAVLMRVNSDTGNNYTYRRITGSGTAATSNQETSVSYVLVSVVNTSTTTANTFGNGQVYIPNLS